MSKHAIALRMLTYLKKEEEYIQDLRKLFDTQLFRLQIEELKLSSMLRNERVRVQKNQERDQSEDEMVESQNLTEELNLSSMHQNQPVRVQKKQQKDQSEAEIVESQNLQALSAPAPVAIPSSDLEPLSLDPDLPMDEEEDEY